MSSNDLLVQHTRTAQTGSPSFFRTSSPSVAAKKRRDNSRWRCKDSGGNGRGAGAQDGERAASGKMLLPWLCIAGLHRAESSLYSSTSKTVMSLALIFLQYKYKYHITPGVCVHNAVTGLWTTDKTIEPLPPPPPPARAPLLRQLNTVRHSFPSSVRPLQASRA